MKLAGKIVGIKMKHSITTEDHVWFEDWWMVASLYDE
jgi:hypothetical protein